MLITSLALLVTALSVYSLTCSVPVCFGASSYSYGAVREERIQWSWNPASLWRPFYSFIWPIYVFQARRTPPEEICRSATSVARKLWDGSYPSNTIDNWLLLFNPCAVVNGSIRAQPLSLPRLTFANSSSTRAKTQHRNGSENDSNARGLTNSARNDDRLLSDTFYCGIQSRHTSKVSVSSFLWLPPSRRACAERGRPCETTRRLPNAWQDTYVRLYSEVDPN